MAGNTSENHGKWISPNIARDWASCSGGAEPVFRSAVATVLEAHAEDCDREWLENVVEEDSGSGWEITHELAALARIGDGRSIPILASATERVTYAWARARALEGLARLDDGHPCLREALWDADDWCVESGSRFSPLDPMAFERPVYPGARMPHTGPSR